MIAAVVYSARARIIVGRKRIGGAFEVAR